MVLHRPVETTRLIGSHPHPRSLEVRIIGRQKRSSSVRLPAKTRFLVSAQRFYEYGDEDYEAEILRGAVEIRHLCDHNLRRPETTYKTNDSETTIRKS